MFKKEICALIVTLVIFSLTYMLRGIYNLEAKENSSEFKGIMVGLTIWVLCDFVPVMFLLIFHFKNFSKREGEDDTEQEEVQ